MLLVANALVALKSYMTTGHGSTKMCIVLDMSKPSSRTRRRRADGLGGATCAEQLGDCTRAVALDLFDFYWHWKP